MTSLDKWLHLTYHSNVGEIVYLDVGELALIKSRMIHPRVVSAPLQLAHA